MKKIGVLALQGAFREHIDIIRLLGHEPMQIKNASQLDDIDGIILPGGESTTMGKLLDDFKIKDTLKEKIENGLPVWGTCAGMILLAKEIEGKDDPHLKVMDITVKRNAYGRQLDSFMTEGIIKGISNEPIPMVFIRAPYITEYGKDVQLLHQIDGEIVTAKEGNILVTSFHPELADDRSLHKYFINMIDK